MKIHTAVFAAALLAAGLAQAAPANDQALASQVEQTLEQAQLMNSDFKVVAHGGRVDLQGWVNAPSDVSEAIKIASAVPGVTLVQSNLRTWSSDDIN